MLLVVNAGNKIDVGGAGEVRDSSGVVVELAAVGQSLFRLTRRARGVGLAEAIGVRSPSFSGTLLGPTDVQLVSVLPDVVPGRANGVEQLIAVYPFMLQRIPSAVENSSVVPVCSLTS